MRSDGGRNQQQILTLIALMLVIDLMTARAAIQILIVCGMPDDAIVCVSLMILYLRELLSLYCGLLDEIA